MTSLDPDEVGDQVAAGNGEMTDSLSRLEMSVRIHDKNSYKCTNTLL